MKTRGGSWVLLLVAISAPPVVGAEPGERSGVRLRFPSGESVVEVPFRSVGGMIVVDVGVNGSPPFGMVLETGWGETALLMADETEGIDFDFVDGRSEGRHQRTGRLATDVQLKLGDLRIEGMDLEVAPKSSQGLLGSLPENGFLGGQFLASVTIEVDWQRERIRFHDPASFEPPAGTAVVPLELRGGHGFATGEVVVDGKSHPVRFIVDTGSAGTLFLRSDRVAPPSNRIRSVLLGRSLLGEVRGDIGRIDELRLGGSSLENMVTRFLDESSGMIAVGADGNLGNEVLRRFIVTFDYARSRLLLRPTEAISDPFPFSTSGLGIERQVAEDGSIGIVDVYADSPAAGAGLEAGDRIVSVNSKPVRELGLSGVLEQLRRPVGTPVRLTFRREGNVREAEFELRAFL